MSLRALGILRSLVIEASRRRVDTREMCAQVEHAVALLEREPAKPADRWEYKVLTLPDLHANAVQCEAMLTPLGLEGWECFHVGGAAWMKRRLG